LPGLPAGRLGSSGKAFQLIREQHLEQLPMHEFLLRIRSQLLWAWASG
jgi:LuxR family maltose regulon positive regulatory protein